MKKYRKSNIILKILFTLSLIINVGLILLNNQIVKTNEELVIVNEDLVSINEEKEIQIQNLGSIIDNLDSQLENISGVNKSYVDELNELRSRSELYDKYEYAIMTEQGIRTELKYEEVKLGDKLMAEKGYNPHLLFGTIMVESSANPEAVNEISDATGYGQFLDSTAEFVWNDLLGYGGYYSEIRKDGPSNILMMAEYYDYLYSTKGSTFEVIKQYSGNITNEGAYRYLSKINDYTQQVGVVIY